MTTTGERIVIGLTTLALVGLAVVIGLLLGPGDRQDLTDPDEERPPVVVSNGSVDFIIDDKGKSKGKGTFGSRLGESLINHRHPETSAPIGFVVSVVNSKSDGCKQNEEINAKSVTVIYGDPDKPEDKSEATITLDEYDGSDLAQLAIDPKGAPVVPIPNEPYHFRLYDDTEPPKHVIKSVSLQRGGSKTPVVCQFEWDRATYKKTTITIRQVYRWPKK